MKVSVVIPTLNEEKLLESTLRSIRSQVTSHRIELIVVDSYSTDSTIDIAKEFADRILFTPPGRISLARQKGGVESTGEIIASAGGDSEYDSHWLHELVKPIVQGKAVATAGKLLPLRGSRLENAFAEYLLNPVQYWTFTFGIHYVGGESMAFSRKAFDKVGGYRTDLVTGEDTDILKRLKKVGKVRYCPRAMTHVSMRRVEEWGYAKYLLFHSANFFRMQFRGKSFNSYEPIR